MSPMPASNSSNKVPLCRTAQLLQNDKNGDLESQEKEIVPSSFHEYYFYLYLVKVDRILLIPISSRSGLYLSYFNVISISFVHLSALT